MDDPSAQHRQHAAKGFQWLPLLSLLEFGEGSVKTLPFRSTMSGAALAHAATAETPIRQASRLRIMRPSESEVDEVQGGRAS
jgi:hypothetical protein